MIFILIWPKIKRSTFRKTIRSKIDYIQESSTLIYLEHYFFRTHRHVNCPSYKSRSRVATTWQTEGNPDDDYDIDRVLQDLDGVITFWFCSVINFIFKILFNFRKIITDQMRKRNGKRKRRNQIHKEMVLVKKQSKILWKNPKK